MKLTGTGVGLDVDVNVRDGLTEMENIKQTLVFDPIIQTFKKCRACRNIAIGRVTIRLNNHNLLACAPCQLIMTTDGTREAKKLAVGQRVRTLQGLQSIATINILPVEFVAYTLDTDIVFTAGSIFCIN